MAGSVGGGKMETIVVSFPFGLAVAELYQNFLVWTANASSGPVDGGEHVEYARDWKPADNYVSRVPRILLRKRRHLGQKYLHADNSISQNTGC